MRDSGVRNFVFFDRKKGCGSIVGKMLNPGRQTISLGKTICIKEVQSNSFITITVITNKIFRIYWFL